MRAFLVMVLLVPVLCTLTSKVKSQDTQTLDDANTVAMLKANFLFNFSKYSDWPTESKQGSFVIGVVGDADIFEELVDTYATKSIGSQMLEVKMLEAPYDLSNIHVVFIGHQAKGDIAGIMTGADSKNIMVITDLEPRIQQGTIINFRVVDSRIQFEVDLSEAAERGIMIGEKIKSWAFNKQ